MGDRRRAPQKTHEGAHVYNHYTSLLSLLEQHAAMGESFTASFTVLRLLTSRDTKCHDAVKAYEPAFGPDGKKMITAREDQKALIFRCEPCDSTDDLFELGRKRTRNWR